MYVCDLINPANSQEFAFTPDKDKICGLERNNLVVEYLIVLSPQIEFDNVDHVAPLAQLEHFHLFNAFDLSLPICVVRVRNC